MDVTPFVGTSRQLLVNGLVKLFDSVHDSGESRWVSLEAPSGSGKTRVGKRFYAQLAAQRQPSPKYWPPTLRESSRDERKLVVPEPKRKEESLPQFFWWGLQCTSDGHSKKHALREGLEQWEEHGRYVSIACKYRQGTKEKMIQELARDKWPLLQEGALEGAAQAASAMGAVLPGMGLAVLLSRVVAGKIRTHRIEKRLVSEVSEPGEHQSALVAEVVKGICELGQAKFPVVLFVEDVHFADDASLAALDALLRRGSHLLVVTTAWSGEIDRIPELSKLAGSLGERVLRIKHDSKKKAPEPFDPKAGLMPLDDDACEAIVRAHYPLADDEAVVLLTHRYRNPRALDDMCRLGRFKKRSGEGGDLHFTPEDIAILPELVEHVYRFCWNQLPESMQLEYAVAAVISPAAISPVEGSGYHTWSAPILADIIESLNLLDAEDLLRAVEASTDTYGWVTRVDEYLRQWTEFDQHHIATKDGGTLLKQSGSAPEEILAAVAEAVLRGAVPNEHVARLVIALHAKDLTTDAKKLITDMTLVAKAVATALADLGYDDTAISERLRLYNRYLPLAHIGIDAHTDLEVRFNGADALAASGRYALAAEAYRALHALTESVPKADKSLTLRSLHELAVNLQNAGEDREAVAAFEQAYAGRRDELGDKHPDTLSSHLGLAEALTSMGEFDTALTIFDQVVDEHRSERGEADPYTVEARWRMAEALNFAGRGHKAVAMYERVLDDLIEQLKEKHPDTMNARHCLAEALVRAGWSSRGVAMFEQVLDDRSKWLGEDDRATLDSLYGLADATESVGRSHDAVDMFERVLNCRIEVLGKFHPDTADARFRFAFSLILVDRADEAITTFKKTVQDHNTLETLETRRTLAEVFRYAGRFDESVDMSEQVLEDHKTMLGKDHPDTLDVLWNIARLSNDPNRVNEYIAQLEQVHTEIASTLGKGHPETLETRRMLAEEWRQTGRVDDLIAVFEEMLQDHITMFQENHPGTPGMRTYVALELQSTGHVDKAVEVFDQVVAESAELLGVYHPETLLSRELHAHALQEAGQIDEAIDVLEQVLVDRIERLGEDHDRTLDTHRSLADALLEAGRVDEAIDILEQAHTISVRVQGEDSIITRNARNYLAEILRAAGRADKVCGTTTLC